MARKRLTFENAQTMWRNFSGERFGTGARDVTIKIDPADVDHLLSEDWPVRLYQRTDEEGVDEGDPIPYIKAKIKYDKYPPAIYMVTSGGPTLLDEVTVNELDQVEIEQIDVIINLSGKPWEINGKTGYAAYVEEMYVVIRESTFAQKYGVRRIED